MDFPFDFKLELSRLDFVLKTQQQLAKDFGVVGIEFSQDFLSTPLKTNQLLKEITAHLNELQSNRPSALSQLLYQIDIPESILPELARTDDFCSSLADVILKREAYKVYLRSKFSS